MRGYVALAAGVALCSFASAASAADLSVPAPINPDRFYVSFHGGYVFSSVTHNSADDGANIYDSIAYGKPGYRVGGAVGKEVGSNFAIEAEVSYASSAIGSANLVAVNGTPVGPTPLAPISGSGSTLTGMINGYLAGDMGAFRPYIGAGIGIGYFTANSIVAGTATLNGTDTGLAAQFLAGVDFAVADGVTLGGRYRYLYVSGLSLPDGGFTHSFNIAAQSVEVVLTTKWQ